MKNKVLGVILTLCLVKCMFLANHATAEMLISPTRAVINDRQRSAQVILLNTSDTIKTYRLGWEQKRALPDGGYEDLDEATSSDFPVASDMLRFSPRQVMLRPNERQIIKIGARRPRDLADGEYRSHLLFTALPSEDEQAEKNQTGIRLKLMLNYSIPIILRQGFFDHDVVISNAEVLTVKKLKSTQYKIAVSFKRTGLHSTYGAIQAYWTPNNGGEEIKVATLNGVHLYAELETINRTMTWQPESFSPTSGTLRIAYEGGQEFNGQIFAEKVLSL
ncbi:fimbrial biogenesis chaperone [Paraglaciecola arctica]|uniref:fimbrial biogenesis chaperone n=1 Tax=Paraglaciecola arctica TaxID=1128911 RepID=UPI001C074A31|nr:fimbria/pilus periplasmic chaperone [Paraglaciecola arctica]MBU3003036.1 fimbria/pilus periplasmic chaperone [Paraglaciecola arctica]